METQHKIETVETVKTVEIRKDPYEKRLERMREVVERVRRQEIAEESWKAPGQELQPFDDVVVMSARKKMGEVEWNKRSKVDTYVRNGVVCEVVLG